MKTPDFYDGGTCLHAEGGAVGKLRLCSQCFDGLVRTIQLDTVEECARTAEEAQRRHDVRCPEACKCSNGHHVAIELRGLVAP